MSCTPSNSNWSSLIIWQTKAPPVCGSGHYPFSWRQSSRAFLPCDGSLYRSQVHLVRSKGQWSASLLRLILLLPPRTSPWAPCNLTGFHGDAATGQWQSTDTQCSHNHTYSLLGPPNCGVLIMHTRWLSDEVPWQIIMGESDWFRGTNHPLGQW